MFSKSFLVKAGGRGYGGTMSFQITESERLYGKSPGHEAGSCTDYKPCHHGWASLSLTSGFSYGEWWSSFLPHRIVKTNSLMLGTVRGM